MNANKNLNFALLKMKKTGDTIVWLSTIDIKNMCVQHSFEKMKPQLCFFLKNFL